MKNLVDSMLHKAKVTYNQANAKMKERFYSLTGANAASVKEIADFIKNHPESKVIKKDYLGLQFTFYEIVLDGFHYYLEMKHSSILQVDVQARDEQIVAYRSYRDKYSLLTPIKFPVFEK
ncbi:hypothetical protein [Cytobacillus massiliigabonensis]|uniref:hypothetical protein n=1 Tax=Cytobacillus massiliigabonensis TaxID=1871011 RepID=UPI000C84A430|nr:hypothetical protein [Cytobacillus massiliigabonensis]